MKNILVTGGAGFIGANFAIHMLQTYSDYNIIVFDKLTYAGNMDNLLEVSDDPRFHFVKGDICDAKSVDETIEAHKIDTIVNFAAETHVDRSIMNPDAFIQTSVYGTYVLLEASKKHGLERFHQISTDEVYGHIEDGYSSVEDDKFAPRSPYAASKASADLLVSAYFTTHQLPVTITRGSNNVGPFQYPEKVVPLFSSNAIDYKPLPVYGDGQQMREYQYVMDHCEAVDVVLHKGVLGEAYNVGTNEEVTNMEMISILLETLGRSRDLIQYVTDRKGHDRRYSMNSDKLMSLGWTPTHTPQEAIAKSVQWYADNEWWWRKIRGGQEYQDYYKAQYSERLKTS